MKLKNIFAFIVALTFWAICNATVIYENDKSNPSVAELKIIDEIKRNEETEFGRILGEMESKGIKLKLNSVQLNSRGGNFDASMEIGKIIREKSLNTFVSKDSVCESSCVFILSSGIVRMALGTVGVHRPVYVGSDEKQISRKNIDIDDKIMSNYLYEMGMSWNLSEAIRMTPSWKIRVLTTDEKINWGLNGTDRMYEELWFRNIGNKLELKRNEIIEKVKLYSKDCALNAKYFKETSWECIERKINANLLLYKPN
jgi:hypothetical protein